MQLLDELSMVYTTCVLFFAIFSHGQSTNRKLGLFAFIASVAVFITSYYHYIKDPLFHQNMFALLTVIVVCRSIYIMETLLRPAARKTEPPPPKNLELRNADILRRMHVMIACGVTSIALGFLIWNLDNIFCPSLRRWRRAIGLPWGVLLEGHGWW
jgi:dihydroceramidase